MYLSFLASILTLASAAVGKILYAGVNESGGEFGTWGSKGAGLPGTFGVEYAFINKTTVDLFINQDKINTFRVAFLMERMCPPATGLGRKFDETYFKHFADAVNHITSRGAYAILDPHNYMRYNDPSGFPMTGSVIGNTTDPAAATTAQFQEFWTELSRRFVFNPRVIFGIQNEPHDMPSSLVLANNQAAINGIRSTGARQLIIAPGNGWTGGHSWTQDWYGEANSAWVQKLKDPLHNLAIDIHEYLDEDFSGGHAECTQPGPANLADVTAWLKANNLKGILSEFGGGDNANCHQQIDDLLNYLADNDSWIGWTYWAAGPIWGTNSPCCGPDVGSIEPGNVNIAGLPNAYQTIWKAVVKPHIPVQTLKRFGVSSLF